LLLLTLGMNTELELELLVIEPLVLHPLELVVERRTKNHANPKDNILLKQQCLLQRFPQLQCSKEHYRSFLCCNSFLLINVYIYVYTYIYIIYIYLYVCLQKT